MELKGGIFSLIFRSKRKVVLKRLGISVTDEQVVGHGSLLEFT